MIEPLIDTEAVWRALGQIMDPEFGVSIVDLGLIYSVDCGDGRVRVVMTLTTPSCPAGAWIHDGVEAALRQLEGVRTVQADVVFDPQWHSSMISAEGRRQLGMAVET